MFNKEQIKKLENHKYIDRCGPKSITYNKEFKLKAVKQYYDGYTPAMIFEQARLGIDKERARECLKRWRKTYKQKGKEGLAKDNRGHAGRPKTNYESDKQKIKYLETKIAYLEEETRLLKKKKKIT